MAATRKTPKKAGLPAAAKPKDNAGAVVRLPATCAARVRMYRHGLGDCFLLSFPRKGPRDFHVLIDCGIILTGADASALIGNVVADVKAATGSTIDVLVATHEHWDHLSGFATAFEAFNTITFEEVWLAWTEKPGDGEADKLREKKAKKVKALQLGVAHLEEELKATGALGAAGDRGAAAADFRRVAGVLSFFGLDPAEPPADGLGAAADKPKRRGIKEAMQWCAEEATGDRRYCEPGEVIDLKKEVPGLRAFVLGPPRGSQLFKDLPTKKGRETYDEDEALGLRAAGNAFLGADVGQRGGDRAEEEFDRLAPFDSKYRIPMDVAASNDFFRTHYFGDGPDRPADASEWRRIDGMGLAGAAAFALQLDSDTNNTSLALAFELADGRVLLFPGDAQVGNWESWHADEKGAMREWESVRGKVTTEDLLNRTAVYKVGHHGSHNATLRGKGLEMMTDKKHLVALVPVDAYTAHEKKGWPKMPFVPLMTALADKTEGRVLVADQPLKDVLAKFPKGDVADSTETITVDVSTPEKRPLFVDYFLPAKPKA